MTSQPIITVSNVTKTVNPNLQILHNISLSVYAGEFISIIGPSGSGKTTLLNTISGLSKPTSGQVKLLGVDPYKLSAKRAAEFRRKHIGFIFQSYNLIPALPAFDNIVLPLRLAHQKINRQEINQLLKSLHFEANPNNFVTTLSGGEQQKVAIARVLVANSQIIFADEPTGALDTVSRTIIVNLLRQLANQGICVMMVTHDIEMAAATDKAVVLQDGHLGTIVNHPTKEALFQALNESEAITHASTY